MLQHYDPFFWHINVYPLLGSNTPINIRLCEATFVYKTLDTCLFFFDILQILKQKIINTLRIYI